MVLSAEEDHPDDHRRPVHQLHLPHQDARQHSGLRGGSRFGRFRDRRHIRLLVHRHQDRMLQGSTCLVSLHVGMAFLDRLLLWFSVDHCLPHRQKRRRELHARMDLQDLRLPVPFLQKELRVLGVCRYVQKGHPGSDCRFLVPSGCQPATCPCRAPFPFCSLPSDDVLSLSSRIRQLEQDGEFVYSCLCDDFRLKHVLRRRARVLHRPYPHHCRSCILQHCALSSFSVCLCDLCCRLPENCS